MFTGIVQSLGRIEAMRAQHGDHRLRIEAGGLGLADVAIGDSIAVNGACLTVVEKTDSGFSADVSRETLTRTAFRGLGTGSPVNLEKSLTPSTPLGGHLVTGHVDAVGEVVERAEDARSVRMTLTAPTELARYIAAKGSICIEGISLTVNAVDGARFEVNLVPHTLGVTTAGDWQAGTEVNLEVDLIARYLERLMQGERAAEPGAGGVTWQLLAARGFVSGEDGEHT